MTDADPWIAFRDKPEDARALAWLPANLERSLAHSTPLPPLWRAALGETGGPRLAAGGAVHRGRLELARTELEQRAGTLDPAAARQRVLDALRPALELSPPDPEALDVRGEVDFLTALRSGVSSLASGAVEPAAQRLLDAAELRPERADVHLYVAAALARDGMAKGARAAAAKALELCPGVARTPQARRAVELGLPPELLAAP